MGITSNLSQDHKVLTIAIQGRFDFSAHQDFRRSYEEVDDSLEFYRVDMAETTYLDSSALGMLLLLRDYAGGDSAQIQIANCSPDVKKILMISNFEQLFDIQ